MTNTKKEIEATKQAVNASLGRIISEYHAIDAEMAKLPHNTRGLVHQSLDIRTEQDIVQSIEGIWSNFRDNDGQYYSIRIERR